MDYQIIIGDCMKSLKQIKDNSIQCCVTSPPYFGLRDYGVDGQIGLEQTPEVYIAKMVDVFREIKRVLRKDGTLWINIGDSYVNHSIPGGGDPTIGNRNIGDSKYRATKAPGLKPKNLIGIPWRLAFALQDDGWYLRQDIIWHKPNPMPESVKDRCTKSHEYIFLLSKSQRYYFDSESMKEPAKEWTGRAGTFDRSGNAVADHIIPNQSAAQHRPRPSKKRGEFNGKTESMPGRNAFRAVTPTRNKRSVWSIPVRPYAGAHFATFPPDLIEPCILAGSRVNDIVLDPFGGSGTTAGVACGYGRKAIICELNPEYEKLIEPRIKSVSDAIAKKKMQKAQLLMDLSQ